MSELKVGLTVAASVGSAVAGLGSIERTINQLGASTDRLRARQQALGSSIQKHMGTLAGSSLASLNRDYERLGSTIDKLIAKQTRLASLQARGEMLKGQRAELRGQAMETAAIGATAFVPIKMALDYENAMLGVAKQVDGARDANGKLTATYYEMGRAIQMMGREIPMATNEIASLVEAGARMGVQGKDNLLIFARNTAMMAEAFEMPVGEIGDQMGKIAGLYKIPIPQIGKLADTINYLDDNTITKGADLINVMQRTAGVLTTVAMTDKNAAALGSTLLTMGENAGTAGTAINAMVQKLAAAEKLPARAQSAIKELGLSAKELQKGMQVDAMGTIQTVLTAINKLPKDARTGVMVELFGMEHADTVAKLVSGQEELQKQIELANSTKAQGSMEREFEARKGTAGASLSLIKNQLTEIAVNIGSAVLPAIVELGKEIGPTIARFADWARANPAVIGGMIKLVASFAALRLGWIGMRYGTNLVLSGFNSVAKAVELVSSRFLLFRAGGLASAFPGIGRAVRGVGLAFQFAGRAVLWMGRALLMNPIGLIVAAIAGAAYLVWKHWDKLSAFFRGFWAQVRPALQPLVSFLGRMFEPVGRAVAWLGEKLQPLITWFRGLISPAQSSAAQLKKWESAGTSAGAMVAGLIGKVTSLASTIKNALGSAMTFVTSLPARFMEAGRNIIDGLIKGITSRLGAVTSTISKVGSMVSGVFRGKMEINSPSRVFARYGSGIVEGLQLGIDRQSSQAAKSAQRMAQQTALAGRVSGLLAGLDLPGRGGGSVGGGMTVNFNPTFNLDGAAGNVKRDVESALQLSLVELERMIKRVLAEQTRRAF